MKQRILIIDDEPPTLNLLARILREKTPYGVTTVSNALEVPGILDKQQFDLIITDLGMPGLDGMQILKLVREKQRFEEVVIITAFGSLASVLEAVSERVFDYLIKPFRKSQIVNVVERAMEVQRVKRADTCLRAVCEREPYQDAEREFRREYLRRLAVRAGGDAGDAARRSGLVAEEIASAMTDDESESEQSEERGDG